MPISLYHGEEEYLLNQAVKTLRAQLVDPQLGGLSHRILNSPSIGDVLEAAGAVCFNLGGSTLIEFHDFPFLGKAASQPADEKQLEELMDVLKTMDDSKHLLFVSAKINKRFKFSKWLASQKFVEAQEFAKLEFWKTDEAAQRLLHISKKKGIDLSMPAAALLVEHQGVEIMPLMAEVEKLAVYAHGRSITPEDVAKLSNHNENTFQMLKDWIQSRNRAKAFHTLDEILLRQNIVPLFAVTQTYVSGIFQLRYWQKIGLSQAEMAERTGKKPFKIKMDLQEFSGVPFERLEMLKQKTLNLEWKSKTGELPPRVAYEILLGS